MPNYTLHAGREIHRDGQPFISIEREGNARPSDVDRAAHLITELLNKHEEDFTEQTLEATPYEVLEPNGTSHGNFATEEEAHGCVAFDKLTAWEIWYKRQEIVAQSEN